MILAAMAFYLSEGLRDDYFIAWGIVSGMCIGAAAAALGQYMNDLTEDHKSGKTDENLRSH